MTFTSHLLFAGTVQAVESGSEALSRMAEPAAGVLQPHNSPDPPGSPDGVPMKFRKSYEEVMTEPLPKAARHFYSFGPFRLYVEERELFLGGAPVALPPKTFDTLLALVGRQGHVVDKGDLMKTLWPDTFVEEVRCVAR